MFDNTELLKQLNEIRLKNDNLIKENDKLNKVIAELQSVNEELSQGDDLFDITGHKTTYSGTQGRRTSHSYSVSRQISWNKLFTLIGPFLFSFITYTKFESELSSAIKKQFDYGFSEIDDDCIQTIKIQLSILSLIEISPQKSTSGGVLEYD